MKVIRGAQPEVKYLPPSESRFPLSTAAPGDAASPPALHWNLLRDGDPLPAVWQPSAIGLLKKSYIGCLKTFERAFISRQQDKHHTCKILFWCRRVEMLRKRNKWCQWLQMSQSPVSGVLYNHQMGSVWITAMFCSPLKTNDHCRGSFDSSMWANVREYFEKKT